MKNTSPQELKVLKGQNFLIYMMLQELVFHFHIGIDMTGSKGVSVWHKKLARYFFANLNGQGPIAVNGPLLVKK